MPLASPVATPVATDDKHDLKTVHSLVQLLRDRSYAEIRQRMYDSPPGSPWWSACKTELDIRNGEQMAAGALATSRELEKMRSSTQHFEQLAETLSQVAYEMNDLMRGTKEAGRRLEIAVYVAIGITLVQLFNLVFVVFRKK
jgi:glutaminase